MRRKLALLMIILGFGGALASQGLAVAFAEGSHAALVDMSDPIMPGTARFLSRAIDKATADGAEVLIVRLDTPGGTLDSTRDMVEYILSSNVPVVIYVSPTGAHATSVGTFITAAAHIAAMAPVTNIGAASPVGMGGEDLGETLKSKATEDAAAFIREIADKRGRNAEVLEGTVTEARAYSATEALENDIIDLIAGNVTDLLAGIDGRTVELKRGTVVLDTDGLEVRKIGKTLLESFLGFLTNPNVAVILLLVGLIGIMIDVVAGFSLIFPAVTGAILLALAYVAFGELSPNWVGVALVAAAVVLVFFELISPGFGGFGTLGVVAFLVGSILVFGDFSLPDVDRPSFDRPVFALDWRLIAGIAGAMVMFIVLVLRDIIGARRSSGPGAATTTAVLVGQSATVTADLAPAGTVHVAGEEWSAVSDSGDTVPQGSTAEVMAAEGLVLRVSAPMNRRARLVRYIRGKEGPPSHPDPVPPDKDD